MRSDYLLLVGARTLACVYTQDDAFFMHCEHDGRFASHLICGIQRVRVCIKQPGKDLGTTFRTRHMVQAHRARSREGGFEGP